MAQSFPDDHKIDELVAKVAPGWKMLETDVYLVDICRLVQFKTSDKHHRLYQSLELVV